MYVCMDVWVDRWMDGWIYYSLLLFVIKQIMQGRPCVIDLRGLMTFNNSWVPLYHLFYNISNRIV